MATMGSLLRARVLSGENPTRARPIPNGVPRSLRAFPCDHRLPTSSITSYLRRPPEGVRTFGSFDGENRDRMGGGYIAASSLEQLSSSETKPEQSGRFWD